MAAITREMLDKWGFSYAVSAGGAAICVVFAGMLHLLAAPQHLEHVGHALFLVLAGVAEVAWGLAFWRKPSAALNGLGVVLAGAFILLWAITRVFPAPLGHGPGDIEAVGVISKVAEGAGLAGLLLMIFLGARSGQTRWSPWRMILAPLTLAVMGVFVLYGTGLAAERMLPWLGDEEHSGPGAAVGGENYDKLAVLEGGRVGALENGGRIALADGIVADVFFSPFPPQQRTDLYLYLIQEGHDAGLGRPEVKAEYSMRYMDHGKYTQPGLELQRGRYLVPLDFLMSGEWAIDLRVGWSEKTARLRLMTRVVP